MAEEIECEQVVLGWSTNTLLGGDGFGPVFASPGWQLPAGDRDAGLGARSRFLPQGAAAAIAEGEPAPRCLSYEPTPAGTLLISKTYATHAARPGQYVLHAVIDPSQRLLPRDLWAGAENGLLLVEQPPGDSSRRWPAARLPLTPAGAEPPLDEVEQAALGILIARLTDNKTTIVQASDQARAAELVRRVVAVLPDQLVRQISLATFSADPERAGVHLCIAVPAFSRLTGPPDLDLDAAPPAVPARVVALVRELNRTGARPGLAQVATLADLWSWGKLRSGRLDELSADDLRRILDGPLWRTFLDRVDSAGPTSLLLDCLLDAELRPSLARRLANPSAATSEQLVRALVYPIGLEARRVGQLQEQVVAVLGSDRFVERILPGIEALAREGKRVSIASPALADLIAETAGAPGAPPLDLYEWQADTTRWSALTDQRLRSWLHGDGPLAGTLLVACRREPEAFAAAIDAVVADQSCPLPSLLASLQTWPARELEVLLAALLHCRRTTRMFAFDVLGVHTAEVVRPLLQQHWGELARQAGLSPMLTELLQVTDEPRRSLWRRGRG